MRRSCRGDESLCDRGRVGLSPDDDPRRAPRGGGAASSIVYVKRRAYSWPNPSMQRTVKAANRTRTSREPRPAAVCCLRAQAASGILDLASIPEFEYQIEYGTVAAPSLRIGGRSAHTATERTVQYGCMHTQRADESTTVRSIWYKYE
eukprot:SAG25_NODE_220_length_11624_cov_41.246508_8_plen_148_part_00